MDDEIRDDIGEELMSGTTDNDEAGGVIEGHSDYKPVNRFDASAVHHLSGMYQN